MFSRSSKTSWDAFTLIEVLVVVAIIALLAAILIPSLQRAREQAKIACCKANTKQIGTIMATYQAEYKGCVPVIYNYGPGIGHYGKGNDQLSHFPAQNHWLPVAFRQYSRGTAKLPPDFAPRDMWKESKRQLFEDAIMDDFYACPFNREKIEGDASEGDQTRTMLLRSVPFEVQEWNGRHCSYHTWMWEGLIVRNLPVDTGSGPELIPPDDGGSVNGPIDGRPQYSVLSWCYARWGKAANGNKEYASMAPPGSAQPPRNNPQADMHNRHRKWSSHDAHRVRSPSLSDVTVSFCYQGTNMGFGRIIRNLHSHRTTQGGGTVAIFADTHVAWVNGFRIGWQ
ncbi:MAG: prepilin-type N-terminal cleavage/methylation domain-containing protein [Planctomycetota bacterium]|jgi:prepilin-type N-terminal cleavage/methylation domain-containing protein